MEIVRKYLTPDEISPRRYRYNTTTEVLEQTPDEGETWNEDTASDPRYNTSGLLPALTGSDAHCRAAEGMANAVRQLVDARIAAATAFEMSGTLIGLFAFIPGFGLLWALIVALATAAFTFSIIVLESEFTEEVYDAIRCFFFCYTSEDGAMSHDQLVAAYDAAPGEFSSVASQWVQMTLTSLGEVGMSNAGVALQAAADCGECACYWCYQWDNVADMALDGWSLAINNPESKYWTYSPATLSIEYAEASWSSTGNSGHASSAWSLWKLNIGEAITIVSPLNSANPHIWSSETAVLAGSLTVGVNTPDGETLLTGLRIAGHGSHPNWTHGSEC